MDVITGELIAAAVAIVVALIAVWKAWGIERKTSVLVEEARRETSVLVEEARRETSVLVEEARRETSVLVEEARRETSLLVEEAKHAHELAAQRFDILYRAHADLTKIMTDREEALQQLEEDSEGVVVEITLTPSEQPHGGSAT